MKYIDAEKLKNEIKRQADLYQDTFTDDMRDKLIDFIDACMANVVTKDSFQQEQPSDYLEEAAIDFADNARKQLYSKDYAISSIADYDHGCIDGFKAGAEWMKRKMMEGAANAYILKSYNPVTEQGEPTLHAIEIELVYEDEGKPYLIAGQRARIIILPKEEK